MNVNLQPKMRSKMHILVDIHLHLESSIVEYFRIQLNLSKESSFDNAMITPNIRRYQFADSAIAYPRVMNFGVR